MSSTKQHFHGSDLEKIAAHYRIPQSEIVNYSGNVNPLGLSPLLLTELSKQIALIASYPDREYTSLRAALGRYLEVDPANILVGNGSTEIISLLIKVVAPQKALVLGPTYSEYEREIFLGGGSTRYYRLLEENDFQIDVEDFLQHLTEDLDLLVLCNPNNPTSTALSASRLRTILDRCKELDIFVLVDETYIEFVEDLAAYTAVHLTEFYNNVLIIRGVSKFFAAPGLRLGYGVCGNQEYLQKINNAKNPWTINALAAYAGELMLQDTEYIRRTRELISTQREAVYRTLSGWPFVKAYAPMANFILVKILDEAHTSQDLFDALIQRKRMIRDASSFPFLGDRFFRFCFLTAEDNRLLLEAIREILAP
ncbi:pyridoxal phosphate-dependent aminotransferase [Anaerotalea alkaliphila]|uniref:Aminotransferase n=1 Tax=Anaerotalea alkaliphila TaxID=2662126 RepID=A0A7X5HX25_9FIRM|nr:threonine-phosphate decarboxylase [Anaerotalea alkaliphila]NDL68198.1 aminotransferase class I/II-fold pyridoxal phosphate-dependent enzyme [Anaerotalea alkaliphila]